jgi:hypothetical protein
MKHGIFDAKQNKRKEQPNLISFNYDFGVFILAVHGRSKKVNY